MKTIYLLAAALLIGSTVAHADTTAGASAELDRFVGIWIPDESVHQPDACFYTTNYNLIHIEQDSDNSVVINRISSSGPWTPGSSITYKDRANNKHTENVELTANKLTKYSHIFPAVRVLDFTFYKGNPSGTSVEEIRLLDADHMRYHLADTAENWSITCHYLKRHN